MSNITGKGGAEIVINPGPWKDVKALKMAVQREAASLDLSGIKLDGGIKNVDISPLISLVLRVDGAPEVDAALWPCLARCTYNKQKIIPETFDDPAAREDYYAIVMECAKVNFGPLVESLISMLPVGLLEKMKPLASDTQK